MHYLGQYSILNYDCIFDVGYVVGATVLAIVASVVALLAFFTLRAAWHTSWWKHALCAVILASGVSGMHWLNAVGTDYRLRGLNTDFSDHLSESTIVTVVTVLVNLPPSSSAVLANFCSLLSVA
jgi:NO-binding membrane sensor protein with MHYT domain